MSRWASSIRHKIYTSRFLILYILSVLEHVEIIHIETKKLKDRDRKEINVIYLVHSSILKLISDGGEYLRSVPTVTSSILAEYNLWENRWIQYALPKSISTYFLNDRYGYNFSFIL